MTVMAEVDKEHPMRKAWEEHKQTDDYANTRRWALHDEHVDGSLWASFCEGWNRAQREAAEMRRLLIAASDEVSCVCGVEVEDEPTPPEECTACCIDALLGTERASYR